MPWGLVAAIGAIIVLFIGAVVWRASSSPSTSSDEVAVGADDTALATTTSAPPASLPAPAPVEVPAGGFDAPTLAATFGDAVVRVDVEGCGVAGGGSGFAVGPNHVVTNHHVAVVDTTPLVVTRDGTVRQGRVVGMVAEPDVALVVVDEDLPLWLAWAEPEELTEGQPIVAMGYPLPATDFTVTSLSIASFDVDAERRVGIRADGRIDRGNSGGPSLTLDGRVAGINTAVNINPGGQAAGILGGGIQTVPLIQTRAAVADHLDQFLAQAETVEQDCAKAVPAEARTYGDSLVLDDLWDQCEAGDPYACDLLYKESKAGSEYEQFGATCGGRALDGRGYCVQRSGGLPMPPR